MEVLESYRDRIGKLISEEDHGIYDAMNKGLNFATGDYVLFLNAGDRLASTEVISNIFNNKPEADIYYGETNLIDEHGVIVGTRSELTTKTLPRALSKEDFLNGQPVSHQSFIVRKHLAGNFDLKYKCSADIDWMLQAVIEAKSIVNVEQSVSNYLLGGTSDRQLLKCWKERALILLSFFSVRKVMAAHVRFALRYLRHGAYKKK